MGFKLNVFTGTLDIVGTSGSGTGVTRAGATTAKSIPRWVGVSQDVIDGSKAKIQDGGAIESQAFVGKKEISDAVVLPSKHYMIASGITIMATGSITISSDSELILI